MTSEALIYKPSSENVVRMKDGLAYCPPSTDKKLYSMTKNDNYYVVNDGVEVEVGIEPPFFVVKNLNPERGFAAYRVFDAVVVSTQVTDWEKDYGFTLMQESTLKDGFSMGGVWNHVDGGFCGWHNGVSVRTTEWFKKLRDDDAFFMFGDNTEVLLPLLGYKGNMDLGRYMDVSHLPYLSQKQIFHSEDKPKLVSDFIKEVYTPSVVNPCE